ncbi:MAG: shikimate kinase [Bacteroidota bacterium]
MRLVESWINPFTYCSILMERKDNIYLIGFMGSGKSTIGQLLAKELSYQWLDLDELIVQRNQMSVRKIFAKYGERFFRKEEATVLRNTLEKENTVISCGGGTPCFEKNMDWINKHGISVFIDPSIEVIFHRLIKGQEKRPLLKDKNGLELKAFIADKLQARRPIYEQAHIHFLQDQENVDAVQPIIKQIQAHHAGKP